MEDRLNRTDTVVVKKSFFVYEAVGIGMTLTRWGRYVSALYKAWRHARRLTMTLPVTQSFNSSNKQTRKGNYKTDAMVSLFTHRQPSRQLTSQRWVGRDVLHQRRRGA